MDKATKQGLITKYASKSGDTGSTEVQIALLTERIRHLTGHMAANRHDYGSQRGLLGMVGHRRRLLSYLNRCDVNRYRQLIKSLGLRK